MNDLFFYGIVFYSFLETIYWYIFNIFILKYLRNIFNLMFDCIIVCYNFLSWNLNDGSLFFIFHV